MQTASFYDVVIIGAGPVGGSLACALAGGGLKVALVDKAALPPMEHPDFDGRAYAIAGGCRRLLDETGLWDKLPFTPCPILDIQVTDGKPGRPASPLSLHFDHKAVGDDPFGWIIEARALRIALNQQLHNNPNITLYAPAVAKLKRTADAVTVQIAGGPRFGAQLAIAADGRNSQIRAEAGITVTRLPYNQSGVVCAIAHEKPHHGVALEHFLPGGPFAQLPMTGTAAHPNVSAIVFTDKTTIANRLHELPADRFHHEVAKRLGTHLGHFELVGRRWTYPLSAMYAARYTATRLALVGDAAHGIHPIAGQGLNLGLRDVMALADILIEAAGTDLGDPALLARYQAARRPANMAMLAATDTLDRLFSTDNPAIRLARDIGLAAVDRMPGLKARFMRAAVGN
ncbi:MAG: ubiquinone biosynthesis protein UbiH [Acidocella sp. 20-57-95]|nr:MAG: ubiquinone biosynthesis protein UbiH [Acidocella sp. 20-57-95]OYV59563.1 MAG: ubiquinone biosynthesis protein UbiH [Acidocella sp. 21-58-7]HQT63328.1 UbiH/UbiF/VisC/COQ6 family ubiquinone biosynthesis hydroxylase [Acidocella sp.]HQU04591.1 UbiH/UbiF/VisC/COQ6 family ubiquinone biosynthesis hydroxylase [Acidocella sp.]